MYTKTQQIPQRNGGKRHTSKTNSFITVDVHAKTTKQRLVCGAGL